MASVFISYSRSDQEFVRKLYDTLVANKHEVFVDWEGIPPSSQWKSELEEAIDKADVVVCVLGPDYLTSPNCLHEIAYAEADRKRLIPIVHREVTVTQVPPPLAAINWIFFRSDDEYDAGVATLEQAIATDLNYVKAATRLLVRAKEWEGKKQNASYLLRGSDLGDAEQWLAQSGGRVPAPSQLQTQYIFVSRRASSRRQRALVSTLSIFLVIVVALSGVALLFYHNSEINRQLAVTQKQLAVTQSKNANVRALAAQCNAPTFGKNLDTRLLLCLLAVRDSERDHVGSYYAYNSLLSIIEANQHVVRYLHTPGAKVGDGNVNVAQSGDGKELASISNTGFFLWNLLEPNAPPVKLAGLNHSDDNYSVALSANGQYAAALGRYPTNDNLSNDLLIVNASTGSEVKYYPYLTQSTYPDATATDISLSADGRYAVSSFLAISANTVSHIVVWPISGDPSKPTKKVTVPHEIDQVIMSPDGKWVGMTGTTGVTTDATYLWNLTTGVVTTVAQFGLSESLTASPSSPEGGMEFNSDGTQFVASGFDFASTSLSQHTSIWSLTSGRPVSIAEFPVAGGVSVYGNDENDGVYVLSCADSAATFQQPCQQETLTDISITEQFVANPQVNTTLSLSGLGTVTNLSGGGTGIVAMGTDTGDIILYLPNTDFTDQTWPVLGPNIGNSSPSESPLSGEAAWLSPNGKYIAAFTQNSNLQLWRVPSNPNQSPQAITTSALTQGIAALANGAIIPSSTPKIAVANDASEIALSDYNSDNDNNVILHHANGQTLTLSVSSVIADLSFDWSGKQLAALICTDKATCKTAELRVWDTSTGRQLSRYTVNNMATLAFTPDGKTIILGGIDAIAFVHLATHTMTRAPFLQQADIVQSMAVSEDGRTLAAAMDPDSATQGAGPYANYSSPISEGNLELQLWDIPTQQPLGTPLKSEGTGLNTAFAFTASGDILDTSDSILVNIYPIGIAHLQSLACQMAHRNLAPSEWSLYAPPGDPESTLCPQAPN